MKAKFIDTLFDTIVEWFRPKKRKANELNNDMFEEIEKDKIQKKTFKSNTQQYPQKESVLSISMKNIKKTQENPSQNSNTNNNNYFISPL